MRPVISSGRRRKGPAVLPLLLLFLLSIPIMADASESCSMLGGKCRDMCAANEQAESGAFEDCGAKEECCVARSQMPAQCCIVSLDARSFGPANCFSPVNGMCALGSPSPVPCPKLQMCATPK